MVVVNVPPRAERHAGHCGVPWVGAASGNRRRAAFTSVSARSKHANPWSHHHPSRSGSEVLS
jgi:hypothetical protein